MLFRSAGSHSKLRTYADGWRILLTMLRLFSSERPFAFYGTISVLLAVVSVVLAVPVVNTYLQTGLVPRFPTAILSTGLMILAALSFFAGLILDTVTRGRRELKALFYLQVRGAGASDGPSASASVAESRDASSGIPARNPQPRESAG